MNNKQRDALFSVIRTLVAVVIALVLALVLILLVSKQPLDALQSFVLGPFSSFRHIGNIIEETMPLIFTGLAACIMFKASQFSMTGEGSFFVGGLVATLVALKSGLPGILLPIAAIVCGGIVGALVGYLPGFLKAKWNANEFVTSMMFNSVLLYFGLFVVNYVVRDPGASFIASYAIPNASKLAVIIPNTQVTVGILIAIGMTVVTYLFLFKSRWGYAIRMTGINREFANYSGIRTFSVIMYSQVLGGLLAGIGGAVEILALFDRFQWTALPGYGFDGLTVAILAGNNPAFVPLGALFMGYLRVGANTMTLNSDVPSELISVIQAILMLLVTASSFLGGWKHKSLVKQKKKEAGIVKKAADDKEKTVSEVKS